MISAGVDVGSGVQSSPPRIGCAASGQSLSFPYVDARQNHLFLMDSFVCQMLGERLYDAYSSLDGCAHRTLTFEGEISRASIPRLSVEAGGEFDVIVAVGGGKVIDVAKMVAAQRRRSSQGCAGGNAGRVMGREPREALRRGSRGHSQGN